jgi:hypothetical protein
MTPDERERMAILCERIAKEQDRDKFTDFVEQLNALLDHKDRRLRNKTRPVKSYSFSASANDPLVLELSVRNELD